MLLHRDESNSDDSPRRINDISPSDDKKKSKRKWVSKINFYLKFPISLNTKVYKVNRIHVELL